MHERVNEPSIDADCSNHICLKVFYQLLRSPGYHSASQLIPNIGPPASSPQTDQTELRTAPHSNFNCGARSVFERRMMVAAKRIATEAHEWLLEVARHRRNTERNNQMGVCGTVSLFRFGGPRDGSVIRQERVWS